MGDRDITDVAPRDRDIAMVFQDYALYPHMSVYDNLAFSLQMRHTARSEVERRVKDVAELLGLEELLRRKPGQLSGGQRQRVALGRAIIREPLVFLMDEPLSNLDAKLRVSMRAELTRLHRRLGVTIIFVTHDQVEAMTMARRIALPLAKPALATVAVFTFLTSWNDFLWPLIVTNSRDVRVVSVGLTEFQNLYYTDWPLLMAASLVAVVPVLVLYVFAQRYFVAGIATTGIR